MSDLFRYVLDSRDKELVTLKEELDFIMAYQFLLKTRFEEKLNIDMEVQIEQDEYIVPMTLQLLIENAVKHNIVSDAYPLKVSIRKQNEYLEVINKLQLRNAGDESKKTGLRNIIQQYSFFSDQPIEIISTTENFIVRVPILKMTEK
jgi:two-component system LytT family sensor kinase